MNKARRQSQQRSKVRGVALIEALVGILIFAFGIIGLVGLQVAMTRAQGSAKYRADAAYLGSQVLGLMWAERTNLTAYNGGSCASHAVCNEWKNKVVSSLPQGNAEIATTPATGEVTLTITWTINAEGTHTHVLSTQIR
jgi:type IV pilus assembly protein PilV